MIIQTILLYPSGAVWTDEAGNVSRLDPSGAVQVDAEHPYRNRKVIASNATSCSPSSPQLRGYFLRRLTAADRSTSHPDAAQLSAG
jgi:hypothetical protein